MKQLLAVLLCLLLCGCAGQAPPAPPELVPEKPTTPPRAGIYDPQHPMEQAYPDLVRAYPLPQKKAQGVLAMGRDILVLSGQSNTALTIYTGDNLLECANLSLDFPLTPDDPSLQIHENGISFFDPIRQITVLLDHRLQEIRQIAAPTGLSGKPILSRDGETVYYCTKGSVMAWDLGSGIRRTVKELSHETQELTALHGQDPILECTIQDEGIGSRLLLEADHGLEIDILPLDAVLHTHDSRYFTALPRGYQTLLIFGNDEDSPELLLPQETWSRQYYLPVDHALITATPCETGIRLDYYELNTGILRSTLTLETSEAPQEIINSKDHAVYLLTYDSAADCDMLYRWDVLRQPPDPANVVTYKAAYCSEDHPDLEALEDCRNYANAIGRKYGIRVRIWEEATDIYPWDYAFLPEYLVPVLKKELELLDQRLARYPKTVLEQTKAHFTGLTICLVRQITGTGDDNSLSNATGIQFFRDQEAYVVITTGKYSEQALYHELYHVMETHILTESTALDQWEALNPSGFAYNSDAKASEIYLRGETRAFVDHYSMRYSKEDRARVLENAMLPGKQDIFRSEYMQRKLAALCTGIREAFRLKEEPEILSWEQYLINPLAPTL